MVFHMKVSLCSINLYYSTCLCYTMAIVTLLGSFERVSGISREAREESTELALKSLPPRDLLNAYHYHFGGSLL